METIAIPLRAPLSVAETTEILVTYWTKDCGHVFDLFDAPLVRDGDRDEFTPLDLLSLGTLNAGLTSAELQGLWLSAERREAEKLLATTPRGRVEHLSESAVDVAAKALTRIAEVLGGVKGWGTRG